MVTNNIVTGTAVADTKTAIGNVLSVKDYDTITFYTDYTKGSEGGLTLQFFGLRTESGDEHPLGNYVNSSGVLTQEASQEVQYSTSGKKIPVSFDVKGVNYVQPYQLKISGTVSGTFSLSFVKTKK